MLSASRAFQTMKAKGHNGKKSDIHKIGDKEYRDHATSAARPPDSIYADNDNRLRYFP